MPEISVNRALVVGGTGLLGRGVAAELVAAGWETTLLSRGARPVPPELSGCERLIASREDAIQETLAWQEAQPSGSVGAANPSPIQTTNSSSN